MKDFSEATSTLKTTPGNLANKAFVCWTRMQAEAGQSLESIIARKEQERQFGAGVFFWGVGTPPSTLIKPLSRIGYPVSVIFSQMKSKPKKADANPESTLIWRSYFENDGKVVDLPPHALITSHGGTKSRPKRTHYALVCSSAQQLRLNWEIPFHPGSFRNASGLQRGVGASQVTDRKSVV